MPTDQDATPVLVVNAGSSSLKVRLLPEGRDALVERIGEPDGARLRGAGGTKELGAVVDTHTAFRHALAAVADPAERDVIALVGHRIVHGGESHAEPVVLTEAIVRELDDLAALAPLHNPANVAGIRAAREALPHAEHVAVFDTAFHATLPPRAYLYALPLHLYRERQIRRYGFHGTSHDVVSMRLAEALGTRREALKIVTLHLGNGASAAAVRYGTSVDTTMGFTPLEGLVMGTRSGDVDPGVLLHLLRHGYDVRDLDDLLNRSSGVLGLSGVSNDLRDVWRAADDGNTDAAAALEVYAYRIRKTIASMAAAMGGVDAVVFTGGVGENDARMREAACKDLAFLGIGIDAAANAAGEARLTAHDASVETWVIATDEEGRIAELTRATVRERSTT